MREELGRIELSALLRSFYSLFLKLLLLKSRAKIIYTRDIYRK